MSDYTPAAFIMDDEEERPTGPRLRDIKEGGHTVITAFADFDQVRSAMSQQHGEWAAYSPGTGSDGVHSFYREDLTFRFKDVEQTLPQPLVLSSGNGIALPRAVIERIWRRRATDDPRSPITKTELIEALNDHRTMVPMGHPYFTEYLHQSEVMAGADSQKGATIGLQMNGRNEILLGPHRVVPGDLLEGVWLAEKDLRAANTQTNRTAIRASIRAVPHNPKRPQTMAQEALKDVLTHTPDTQKAMHVDPWSSGSDDAGYSADDGNFVGATLARGSLIHALLAMNYLMNQKVITVTVNEAVVGPLPAGVPDDFTKTTAFLAQLIGALPVDPSQSDYMLAKVPPEIITCLFRETVLSMIMPESLKVHRLLFGTGRDGESNELLSETTGRLKNKATTAAQLFHHQHDGLNKMIAAFTQLLNGHNEHVMGVALRGEPAHAICSYLRR